MKFRLRLSEGTGSGWSTLARGVLSLSFVCLFGCPQAWALREGGGGSITTIRTAHFAEDTCQKIMEEAGKRQLPESFLARLIWKESLFRPDAVSHKGAQGIAQFMPGTASERGLDDAFNPAKAIAASAQFLADLRDQFGNLGLAAAAYNAGPQRVAGWLAKNGGLPPETQDYVHFITGHFAEDWVGDKGSLKPLSISDDLRFNVACPKLVARQLRARTPDGSGPGKKQSPALPWGVQVAAHFSPKVALAQFSRTKAKFPSILKGPPITVTRKNPRKGLKALQTVRVGAPSRAAAETICNKLRGAGGACIVVKN